MENFFIVTCLVVFAYLIFCSANKKRHRLQKKSFVFFAMAMTVLLFGACSANDSKQTSSNEKTEQVTSSKDESSKESTTKRSDPKKDRAQESEKQESIQKTKSDEKKAANRTDQQQRAANKGLADLKYQGTQTINVNNGVPTFSEADMSTKNGSWERYGDLDSLNRATSAEAMLNQATMPKQGEKRGSISDVTPTGWKNKKIPGGYLYNRSHLIGWALSAENNNWKNLITGTRQLNSPEMLRFEMDIKAYLEQSSSNYVRYSVTPIFRGNELLARGVHLMAKSVGENSISFNVFIFNVQDGVKLNYADGSSNISGATYAGGASDGQSQENRKNEQQQVAPQQQSNDQNVKVYVTPTGDKYHNHPHGRGNFKATTLKEAKAQGLQPCKICDPPA